MELVAKALIPCRVWQAVVEESSVSAGEFPFPGLSRETFRYTLVRDRELYPNTSLLLSGKVAAESHSPRDRRLRLPSRRMEVQGPALELLFTNDE